MKKFIHYLDSFKETDELQAIHYIPLLDQMNMHFIKNKLSYSPPYIFNPISNYSLWQIQHDFTYKFDEHSLSSNCFTPITLQRGADSYLHRYIFPSQPIEPKTYKEIDVKIDSIKDILQIIDKYPYDDSFEYNIDLKMLHAIKSELYNLNNMIGLSTFKQQIVDQLIYFIQNLHKGEGSIGDYKHTVLYGPPGTGKTEIAKIIGQIYAKIGILPNQTFKKVTRSDLIAGYLGQTAIKTQKVIESSLGGVLFIDEAYSLADLEQRDSFSKECVDTLCEALSQYKDNWLVIIAGYETEIKQQLFKTNPGLESRFIWRFTLDTYTPMELFEIFKKKVEMGGWSIDPIIGERWFSKNKASFPFLGRDMEGLFTYSKIAHSRRIFGLSNKSGNEKKRILLEDLDKGFESFEKFSKNKPQSSVLYDMYC